MSIGGNSRQMMKASRNREGGEGNNGMSGSEKKKRKRRGEQGRLVST